MGAERSGAGRVSRRGGRCRCRGPGAAASRQQQRACRLGLPLHASHARGTIGATLPASPQQVTNQPRAGQRRRLQRRWQLPPRPSGAQALTIVRPVCTLPLGSTWLTRVQAFAPPRRARHRSRRAASFIWPRTGRRSAGKSSRFAMEQLQVRARLWRLQLRPARKICPLGRQLAGRQRQALIQVQTHLAPPATSSTALSPRCRRPREFVRHAPDGAGTGGGGGGSGSGGAAAAAARRRRRRASTCRRLRGCAPPCPCCPVRESSLRAGLQRRQACAAEAAARACCRAGAAARGSEAAARRRHRRCRGGGGLSRRQPGRQRGRQPEGCGHRPRCSALLQAAAVRAAGSRGAAAAPSTALASRQALAPARATRGALSCLPRSAVLDDSRGRIYRRVQGSHSRRVTNTSLGALMGKGGVRRAGRGCSRRGSWAAGKHARGGREKQGDEQG